MSRRRSSARSADTDGIRAAARTAHWSSRCSSTSRRPISLRQVRERERRERRPRERRPVVSAGRRAARTGRCSRRTSARRSRASATAPERQPRQPIQDVRHHLAAHRPARVRDPPQVVTRDAGCAAEQQEPGHRRGRAGARSGRTAASRRAPTRRAGRSRSARRPRGRGAPRATRGGGRCPHLRGVADGDPPRPRERRRLDARRSSCRPARARCR